MPSLLSIVTHTSLVVQLVTLCLSIHGVYLTHTKNIKPRQSTKVHLLGTINTVEFVVQLIEGVFYVYMAIVLTKQAKTVTLIRQRYYDWIITTPFMLYSTAMVMKLQSDVDEDDPPLLWITIVVSNMVMLVSGWMYEHRQCSSTTALGMGYLGMMSAFGCIAWRYMCGVNTWIWGVTVTVWLLYGVFLPFDAYTKNVGYTCLDTISKNMFGVYAYTLLRYQMIRCDDADTAPACPLVDDIQDTSDRAAAAPPRTIAGLGPWGT
jgi:hypothetical protein